MTSEARARRAIERERKRTLSVRNPAIERLLSTIPVQRPANLNDVRDWTSELEQDVTRWVAGRLRGQVHSHLTRSNADAALARALAELTEGSNDDV